MVAALARLPPRRQADVGDHLTNIVQPSGQARRYSPFYFAPNELPGFPDYQLTYSQFRVLKCRLQLSLGSEGGEVDNFLVAPSRPFARNMGPVPIGTMPRRSSSPRRRDSSTSDQMAEGHLSQQDNQEAIDRLQAVHPGGHPGPFQRGERPVVSRLGGQPLDALQLG